MTPPLLAPANMIVLASDPFWPVLQGLMHWRASLRRLFVLQPEEAGGHQAAQRLAEFCRAAFVSAEPALAIEVLPVGGPLPQDLHGHLEGLLARFPGETWLLQTGTQGLPLAAAIPWLDRTDVVVAGQGPQGEWLRLSRAASEAALQAESLDVPKNATDGLPVALILQYFWQAQPGAATAAGPRDVLDLTKAAQAVQGDWGRLAAEQGLSQDQGKDHLFQEYLAQAVRDLGAANVALHVRQPGTGKEEPVEVDLAVNHGGRLWLIDAKLHRQSRPGTYLRRLAQARAQLGPQTEVVYVWPLLPPGASIVPMFEDYQFPVLGMAQTPWLLSQLQEMLGAAELPESLRQAQAIIAQEEAQGRHFFSPGRAPRAEREEGRREPRREPRQEERREEGGPEAGARPEPRRRRGRRERGGPERGPDQRRPASTPPPVPVRAPIPVVPLAALGGAPVRVTIRIQMGAFPHLNFIVAEEGAAPGSLRYGTPPSQLPKPGDVVEVFRVSDQPLAYSWSAPPQ